MVGIFFAQNQKQNGEYYKCKDKNTIGDDYYRKENYKLYKGIKTNIYRVDASESSIYKQL